MFAPNLVATLCVKRSNLSMQNLFRLSSVPFTGIILGMLVCSHLPASGAISTGLEFNGANNYVTFGVAPELGTATFTLETWFQWTGGGLSVVTGSGGVDAIPLVAKGRGESDGNNRDMNYLLGIRPGDQVLVADFEEGASGASPGQNHPVAGVTRISSGVWHHAAVTYDGSNWRLYLDGTLETTQAVGQPPRADSIQHASLATALDSSGTPAGYFAGVLDEVRIWNTALPASQISSNMNRTIGSAPGLIGRWSLDEGVGSTIQDSSGTGVTGTLMQAPAWVAGYAFSTPPVVALTHPADQSVFFAPADLDLEASASDVDGTVQWVEFFSGSTKLGEAPVDPFTYTWNNVQPGRYVLQAVATDNDGLSSTSAPVKVNVENPIVQISSPPDETVFLAHSDIALAAEAADPQGAITLLEFFEGHHKIGEASNRPFQMIWRDTLAGNHSVTAVSTDVGGIHNTSAPVNLTVISNIPPTVSITGPLHNAVLYVPASMTIQADAADIDGAVTNVQFFQGSTLQGSDDSAPYSLFWPSVPAGDYRLTAVAQDNWGYASTSSVVHVRVLPTEPPTVSSFTPPAGVVSNLTQITVLFSEPVDGVNASDLLVNGAPASVVIGADDQYTFNFPMPAEGLVTVAWAGNHGIVDRESNPRPFNGAAAGETVQYNQVDTAAPVVSRVIPPPGTVLRTLSQITIVFSEPVRGVQAEDLLVNGVPSRSLTGSDTGPYVFSFPELIDGTAQISWGANPGITDFSQSTNAFAGGTWEYTLDPNASFDGAVVINEIMYHPASENLGEEYIELRNITPDAINLANWRFSRGVDFTFTNVSLPGNGYLVVAADLSTFQSKYPGVTNVVGNWTGRLSNDDEDIELEDATGERVDLIHYADEGDWAVRQRGPNDGGYYGWEWFAPHDGSARNNANGQTVGDRSLELVNPLLPNDSGQNWDASQLAGGTPGASNSMTSTNTGPLILDVIHFPLVPNPTDSVTITARIVDDSAFGSMAALRYRNHNNQSPVAFSTMTMFDDGQHNDGNADDGVFATALPPYSNGTVIEFYVEATDNRDNSRTWPPAARQLNGSFAQTANALYQVDENLAGVYAGGQPVCRLVMTESERYELEHINRGSDAEMNATLIVSDGTGTHLHYRTGMRIRGSGSRSRTPPNYRVNIPSDDRWNGLAAVNLNTQFIHSQLAGSAVALKSGLPTAAARIVQVRVNGANLSPTSTPSPGSGSGAGFGAYVLVEPLNGDWAKRHFPTDGDGNVYRVAQGNGGTLYYRDQNPSSYTGNYCKTSNQSENDWTDLIRLSYAVSSGLPDAAYLESVRTNANVQMWMRYFAVCSLLVYSENGLPTGVGDDYALYRGIEDPRFLLIPHDFDTVLGEGDGSAFSWGTGASIWLPIERGGVPFLNRFMRHNEFAPLYFRELKQLAETTFSAAEFNPFLDQLLGRLGAGKRDHPDEELRGPTGDQCAQPDTADLHGKHLPAGEQWISSHDQFDSDVVRLS